MPLRLLMLLFAPALASAEPAPRTDAHGDPLPHFARARLGTQRFWHAYKTTAVAFSPDGKTLATAANDIRLWDVATGKELRRFDNPGDRLKSLDFTADGRTLIGAGTFTPAVYLVDAGTGKLRHRFGKPPFGREVLAVHDANEVRPIALLADGKTLAAPFREERSSASPKGGTIHQQPHQCIRSYDSSSGKLLGETKLEGTWRDPQFIAVTADGKTLACVGEEQHINIWDRASAKRLRSLAGHKDYALCGAFSGDGKTLATGGMDQRVRLWDVTTGKQVRELTGHESSVRSVYYLPDGTTLLSVSSDRIRLWESATGKLVREFRAPRDSIHAAALSPRGTQLAAVCFEGTIVVWDVASGQEVPAIRGHRASVNALAFSADGQTLVSGGGDAVFVWDAARRTTLRRLGSRGTTAERMAFLPADKALVVADSWRPPELWEVKTGKRLHAFKGPKHSEDMRLSPDGKFLATLVGKRWDSKEDIPLAYFWDVRTGAPCGTIKPDGKPSLYEWTQGIAFTADGKLLATGGVNNKVHLWSVPEGKLVRILPAESAHALAVAPDGNLLAAYSFGVVTFHEMVGGKEVGRAGESSRSGASWDCPLVFSTDGRTLAVGGEGGIIRLCEVATGGERRRFEGHTSYVRALAFAPDGKTLVSGGADTTILVWDVAGVGKAGQSVPDAWASLADGDARRAYDGICALAAAPKEAVAFLKARVPRLRPVPPETFQKLIGALHSDRFAVRDRATRELELLQELAVPPLRKLLQQELALEVRLRVQRLLAKIVPGKLVAGGERLRWLRVLEALERMGTQEARDVVRMLADGDDAVQLTRAARAGLRRCKGVQ